MPDEAGYNVASLCKEREMPIYTYRCENCGVQFERRQSFTDEPLIVCPECNQNQLRKVITPAGIVFKGSGWYVTDHKSKSSAVQPASSAKAGNENKSDGKDAAPVASAAPASDVGTSTNSSGDSSASKGESSTAKNSTGE